MHLRVFKLSLKPQSVDTGEVCLAAVADVVGAVNTVVAGVTLADSVAAAAAVRPTALGASRNATSGTLVPTLVSGQRSRLAQW